jgi:hypothetical protein
MEDWRWWRRLELSRVRLCNDVVRSRSFFTCFWLHKVNRALPWSFPPWFFMAGLVKGDGEVVHGTERTRRSLIESRKHVSAA